MLGIYGAKHLYLIYIRFFLLFDLYLHSYILIEIQGLIYKIYCKKLF